MVTLFAYLELISEYTQKKILSRNNVLFLLLSTSKNILSEVYIKKQWYRQRESRDWSNENTVCVTDRKTLNISFSNFLYKSLTSYTIYIYLTIQIPIYCETNKIIK